MLLRSSEVSLILSSTVVVVCGIAIFLAGYVLQQSTLEQLHSTLRPHNAPSKQIHHNHQHQSPLANPYNNIIDDTDLPLSSPASASARVAYAHLVSSHAAMCDALVLLHELYASHCTLPRLLLFPRAWLRKRSAAAPIDPALDASVAALRKAARWYEATLVPIAPLGSSSGSSDEEEEGSYSIASAFSLTHYSRVMMLPTPALVLDSQPLDTLLALEETLQQLAVYPPTEHGGLAPARQMLLVTPNKRTHQQLQQLHRLDPAADDAALLGKLFPQPLVLSAESDPDTFRETMYSDLYTLRGIARFNATAFAQETALFRIDDTDLPAPQFEAPYEQIVKLRPADADQAFLWESLYSRYKERRYNICGLSPMPLP